MAENRRICSGCGASSGSPGARLSSRGVIAASLSPGSTPGLAEEEGFEPPEPFGSTVFKTAALNHSATPPRIVRSGCPRRDYPLSLLDFAARRSRGQVGEWLKPAVY